MKKICAWCQTILVDLEGGLETHTICEPCAGKYFPAYTGNFAQAAPRASANLVYLDQLMEIAEIA